MKTFRLRPETITFSHALFSSRKNHHPITEGRQKREKDDDGDDFFVFLFCEHLTIAEQRHELVLEATLPPIVGRRGETDHFCVPILGLFDKVHGVLHGDVVRLVDDHQTLLGLRNLLEAHHELHARVEVFVSEFNKLHDIGH